MPTFRLKRAFSRPDMLGACPRRADLRLSESGTPVEQDVQSWVLAVLMDLDNSVHPIRVLVKTFVTTS